MSDSEDFYDVENVDQYIDFFTELRPYPHIIDQIFQYLTNRELCLIPLVSKSWGQALDETFKGRERHKRYLKKVRKVRKSVGQENWPIKKRTPVPTPVATTQRRDALSDIRNVYRTRKPKNNRSTHSITNTQTPNTRQKQRDNNLRGMR